MPLVSVRLQALPYTSRNQAWIRNIQPVDGSSDVHAVGGAVSSVLYIRSTKTSERTATRACKRMIPTHCDKASRTLGVPARLHTLSYTRGHLTWIRNMRLVDGSSDVHSVGGAVISVSYSSLLVPLPFSAGPFGEQTGRTAFPRFLSRPCPFASVSRCRTKGADLMPRVGVLPRVVAG